MLAGEVHVGGGKVGWLAGAKSDAFISALVNVPPRSSTAAPRFNGSMDDLLRGLPSKGEGGEAVERLRAQLQNEVKKCAKCGKPNGFSMLNCNACGALLPDELVRTPNVFAGFLYGVARGPFPYTISLRMETPDLLVIDDLLSMTPCHLNAIPASHYIRDWRQLLMRPSAALSLLTKLESAAWSVVETQFLANEAFRAKIYQGSGWELAALRESGIAAGMNFPPSQFQLHLQYMVMPLLPQHFALLKEGHHYTKGRFFPLEYLRAVLSSLEERADVAAAFSAEFNPDSSIESIVAFFTAHGVADYDQVHAAFLARIEHAHRALANWRHEDFEFALVAGGDAVYRLRAADAAAEGVLEGSSSSESTCGAGDAGAGVQLAVVPSMTKAEVTAADKLVLQNYGRPYDGAKPGGTFFQFACDTAAPVPNWLPTEA
eukprot:g1971.t1